MRKVLLVRYGEVHLKGLNRPYFMQTLMRHIRSAVSPLDGVAQMREGRIYVWGLSDMAEGARRVSRVFGVHSVSIAVEMDKDMEAIKQTALELMREKSGTFKVEARRSDKRYPMDSPSICAYVGGYILENSTTLSVNVRSPEHVISIEIREMAYIYTDEIEAVGGMPMGTNGKATLLLSGGIDSPVAGYLVARRGVSVSCVHFHSPPYTGDRAKEKVIDLARVLAGYCGDITVHMIPFTDIQTTLYNGRDNGLLTILMRRFMMRIAERIAVESGSRALITGESIGQVASQTMEALVATDAVVGVPVFRPLIGNDKLEIVRIAKDIGTYDISIRPFEDCCTVFTPKHPTTHPKLENVLRAEEGLAVEDMVGAAVVAAETVVIAPFRGT